MPQSSNRFGIDEVNTQLTAPTSNVQVQGPMDTSLTTRTRSSGIKNFSDALGGLAKQKLAQKIHNDTIEAQLSSAYNREQPGGLEPEAVFAFNKSEDLKIAMSTKQNMANYALVEGAAILTDSSLTRKEKLSHIQSGLRGLINTGLQGITPVNNIDIVPDLENQYNKYSLAASTDLAKQKKEEESSINGVAVQAAVDTLYSVSEKFLVDRNSGENTIRTDDDLSPKDTAQLVKDSHNYVATNGLSVKNFNLVVDSIAATKVGADNREIKATVLTAMVGRLLRAVEEGDFTADPRLVTNLIDKLKGNPQAGGSTLRSEINSGTEYGKIFKTIEDGYRSNLTTLLSNKRTRKNQSVIDADNKIGNDLFDNKENFTQKQGQDMLLGMSNFKSQLTALKRWDALFDDSALNGPTSPAYLEALIGGDDVLTSNGRRIDDIAFSKHVIEHHLNGAAQTELRKRLDPESKESKHRTKVLENNTVKLLLGKFRPAVKSQLQVLEMNSIIAEFFKEGQKGALPPTPLVLAGISKKFKSGSQVYQKTLKILNAELTFSKELESLILSNPDKEAAEIAELAEKRFNLLFNDVISDVPIGETENREKKSILEKRLEDKRKLSLGEPAASGAVTKEVSPAQEKQKIEVEKKAAVARVLADVKDPDTMIEYIALAAKEFEAERAAVEANHKMNGIIPATRREKMGIIFKYGGTPTGRDGDIRVSENAMAAIATNPEAALILRAKALQLAAEEELSKSVFTFRGKKEILKNKTEGKELFKIGNLQFTLDDFANFTLDGDKEILGNVGYHLGLFMESVKESIDSLRVVNREGYVPEKRPVSKPQITVEQPKITDKRSLVQKAAEGLTKTIGALTLAGDTGAAGTSQDANFDPDAPGSRGFDQDNKPQEGTRNELAKDLGVPSLSENSTLSAVSSLNSEINDPKFGGGTSAASDIEGFTGENVDAQVQIQNALPLSGLSKEIQEDIKRQLEGRGVINTKPSSFDGGTFVPNKSKSNIQRTRDVVIKEAELGDNDKRKYGTKPYLSYASWKALGKPARALTSQTQLPPSDSSSVKSGATIGYGHDILKSEIGSGKIHGVSFLNRDGTFKDLTEQQLDIIFQEDLKISEKAVSKDYSKLSNMPDFKSLPNSVQVYMTDIWFNMGKLKTEFPKGLAALEALNMIKVNPNLKPAENIYKTDTPDKRRLRTIILNSQESGVGGKITWDADRNKNIKRLLEVFKAEITDRSASPKGVKKRAKDLWKALPIEKDLRSFMELK